MIRTLLLLLMVPSTFVPPGMCVCQFVPTGTASSARLPSVETATTTRPDCKCDSCRTGTSSADPERDDHSNRQPADGPSGPGPTEHWPGCPAEVDAVPASMSAPTVVTAQADLVATAEFYTPVAAATVPPVRTMPASSPAVSPPLFISHCTLLI